MSISTVNIELTDELADEWVKALKSGDYQQGEGKLRDGYGGYCCLGVLCDIIDPEGWTDSGRFNYNGSQAMYQIYLLRDGKEIPGTDGTEDGSFAGELADRNDGKQQYRKHGFNGIAKVIQAKMKELRLHVP